MESPPPPQEDWGNIIRPWGTSNFPLPQGRFSQMERFKIIHTFFGGGNRLFSSGGMGGGVPPPLTKNLPILPSPGKVPPSRLPVSNPDKKCIWLLESAHFHETSNVSNRANLAGKFLPLENRQGKH